MGPQVESDSARWRKSQRTGDGLEGKAKMEHKKELGGAVSTPGDPSVSDRMEDSICLFDLKPSHDTGQSSLVG